MFALLLHTNPNEKEIFTTINPTTKPLCPRYLLILNEIIHTSLLAEYDQEKIELSQFIIDKLIQLIEKIKSIEDDKFIHAIKFGELKSIIKSLHFDF